MPITQQTIQALRAAMIHLDRLQKAYDRIGAISGDTVPINISEIGDEICTVEVAKTAVLNTIQSEAVTVQAEIDALNAQAADELGE